MTLYLAKQDLDVLAALEDRADHGVFELADALELAPHTVRSILTDLRRRHLVSRDLLYRIHITDTGLRELADRRQLKLVEGQR